MTKQNKKSGFTLIELSIVLVIIGLIVGGVLVGQSLIEAAKMRSVVTDIEKYRTAFITFRLKYNAMPGDMNNAVTFWGGVSGSCATVSGTGTQTCNGDGDELIDYIALTDSLYESWRAWQHLSNAGLINGNFTGISNAGTCSVVNYCATIGKNIPASNVSGAGWMVTSPHIVGADWGGKNELRSFFSLTNPGNNTARNWFGNALTPLQMYNIDLKTDDGKPFSGRITDMSGLNSAYSLGCTSGTDQYTDANAAYETNTPSVECILFADVN